MVWLSKAEEEVAALAAVAVGAVGGGVGGWWLLVVGSWQLVDLPGVDKAAWTLKPTADATARNAKRVSNCPMNQKETAFNRMLSLSKCSRHREHQAEARRRSGAN